MKKMKSNGASMPKEHFERNMSDVESSDLKYASKSTMENPEDYKRSADGLSNYVRKHKMKY